MSTWTSLSQEIEAVVEKSAPSIVQVHGRRRVTAGLVVADNLIVTPAVTDEDTVSVRLAEGQTLEGHVVGRIANMGVTVVRADALNRPALDAAAAPRPGHLAVAIGRTWSGGIMASLAPVTVVGGPLRTGRAHSIERVIRIQHAPHGALNGGALIDASGRALGIITALSIRGTTVVVPATLAWEAASRAAAEGGTKQGFIGVSSIPVPLPVRQRAGRSQDAGLLISHVATDSPADAGGLLVGDVIVGFGGQTVQDPDALLTHLRATRIGAAVPITVIRGANVVDVTVSVSERPTLRG